MSFSAPTNRHFTIEVTTTALCNLACTYCVEGVKVDKRRLDDKIELVKQRITELLDSEWIANNYDTVTISFWGGEPTLNGDMIATIMNEFNHRSNVDFHIYTNGYERRRIEKLIDAVDVSKLHVQFSYDGKQINDKFRITATGKTTSVQVVENIEYFAKKGLHISLKSTVPSAAMSDLYGTWKDFERLHAKLNNSGANIQVRYSPTIDYINVLPNDELPPVVTEFREAMLKIASEEINFVKKHGYHLMSWFGGRDGKIHCGAGAHMHVIDVDGQTYACHGSLYSPNKEILKGSSIEDDSFVDDIAAMATTYQEHIREVSPICQGCVATTCIICPVASLDRSTNETFQGRWTDRWVNSMCGFFKAFGEIDRTVQSYLTGELTIPSEGEK